MVWLKTLTAPPRGNIPDGIKELTLQTVNIPTRGSQQETGWGGGVNVGLSPLIGDLSIHLTECCRAVKEKPKGLDGRGTLFICLCPKGHICCRREEDFGGGSSPVTWVSSRPAQTARAGRVKAASTRGGGGTLVADVRQSSLWSGFGGHIPD